MKDWRDPNMTVSGVTPIGKDAKGRLVVKQDEFHPDYINRQYQFKMQQADRSPQLDYKNDPLYFAAKKRKRRPK